MASTYLSRTPSSAGNTSVWTASFWMKCSSFTNQDIFNAGTAGTNHGLIFLNANQQLEVKHYSSSAFQYQLVTNRRFRDCNAWYHIVVTYNDLESTSSDRIKIYVNGVQETSFATANYPSLNFNSKYNETILHTIGRGIESGTSSTYRYFDGSMSHFNFIDGTAYAASTFGETDSTTGQWKINTNPSVTYGTNGFFILKDGNSVTDQSGNSNNWTVGGGTLTKTEDCPSNVFATLNPLHSGSITFSNGNNTQGNTSSTGQNALSTLGAVSGKFYAEVKCTAVGSNGTNVGFVNLSKSNLMNQSITPGQDNFSAGLYSNGGPIYYSSETTFATVGSTSNGDIIQLAMDLDNGYLYWGRNGTYLNSGDPTSGSTGTGGLATSNLGDGHIGFGMWQRNSATASWNFGNGYFGTTAVSSAGTNASGNGIFEYDVPTGFTALSTKGLNE